MIYKPNYKRNLLLVIMDGVGCNTSSFGNAVSLAYTPTLDFLKQSAFYTKLYAHGTFVGLPTNQDMGNSEVGHNTIGSGRALPQGASLVKQSLETKSLYKSAVWQKIVKQVCENKKTLHFLGLLSDGNVHSHEQHLYHMLKQAKKEQVPNVRIHVLFDGRDVAPRSAEKYINRLEQVLLELRSKDFSVFAASAGGRMCITMDRYQANWTMVKKGWETHVLGQGPQYKSLMEGLTISRKKHPLLTDQDLPPFVITEKGLPIGKVQDGDGVICFNFRGDRAIEISQAFDQTNFPFFNRTIHPKVTYAGLLEYDADLQIPKHYLIKPPPINNTLSEYMSEAGLTQFACSETQKYGHVTYFWNGNRSGYFNKKLEDYLEIPSDNLPFDQKPWMKAYEITEATISKLNQQKHQFLRINLANGDMVGHTGSLQAATVAMSTVDLMLSKLLLACQQNNTILVVTADHGNCEEMFNAKEADYPLWQEAYQTNFPPIKTSHTLSKVPFIVFDPRQKKQPGKYNPQHTSYSLANIANTILQLMGVQTSPHFAPSIFYEN